MGFNPHPNSCLTGEADSDARMPSDLLSSRSWDRDPGFHPSTWLGCLWLGRHTIEVLQLGAPHPLPSSRSDPAGSFVMFVYNDVLGSLGLRLCTTGLRVSFLLTNVSGVDTKVTLASPSVS